MKSLFNPFLKYKNLARKAMANKDKSEKEKKAQRHRDKRAERRQRNNIHNTSSSSSSSENENENNQMSRANGTSSSAPMRDHRSQNGTITKMLSMKETLEQLCRVVSVLELTDNGHVASAAQAFSPEIELKMENERLRGMVDEFKQVVENQKVRELEDRCNALEAERPNFEDVQRRAEQERNELASIHADMNADMQRKEADMQKKEAELREGLEKEKKEYQAGFQKKLKDAERRVEKLEASKREMEKDKQKTNERMEDLQTGNDALMSEMRTLKAQLRREKSKLRVESKGVDF
jgi:hypothetical protein